MRDRLKAIIPAKYLESIFIAEPLDERMEILIFPHDDFQRQRLSQHILQTGGYYR